VKIVIDTNIVFSAILNVDSNISKLILLSGSKYDFYSCEILKAELDLHKSKILKITGYSQQHFHEINYLITKNITFINHHLIGKKDLSNANAVLENIDQKDAPFYALAKHLKAKLCTGDKVLLKGLIAAGYKDTITTSKLLSHK